jgi:hypothetical protein
MSFVLHADAPRFSVAGKAQDSTTQAQTDAIQRFGACVL